jgi:hypothetical protein
MTLHLPSNILLIIRRLLAHLRSCCLFKHPATPAGAERRPLSCFVPRTATEIQAQCKRAGTQAQFDECVSVVCVFLCEGV